MRHRTVIVKAGEEWPAWLRGFVPKEKPGSIVHLATTDPYSDALCGMTGLGFAVMGGDERALFDKRFCGECVAIAQKPKASEQREGA